MIVRQRLEDAFKDLEASRRPASGSGVVENPIGRRGCRFFVSEGPHIDITRENGDP